MKNSKKGISLIVLIITIIVIIILATAILVSVISNNPISEANKARYESDRDNMQAVFTNTVGKIMAENQGVVNVTAGQINTETKDVAEATGEVAYTVDNATVASNGSGKIYFDKGTNDATTYYTGKKLPIYAAGETKWYVDSEGVLSLEVAEVKYGSGEVENESNNDAEYLAAGFYRGDGMFISWDEIVADRYISVDNDGSFSAYSFCDAYESGMYDNDELVISDSVTTIKQYSFADGYIDSIVIPTSVVLIEEGAFDNLIIDMELNYNGTKEQWNAIQNLGYSGTIHCTDGDIII